MKRLRLNTAIVPVAVAFLVGPGLFAGCQSDSRALPRLPRDPAFSRSGEREDLEIRVQVSPVEGKAHWYKMESAIIQKNAGGASLGETRSGHDRLSFPTLQAAVGANAVAYQFPNPEPGTEAHASFRVYEQEGKLIAEYEVGYAAKEGDSFTRKGRLVLKLSATD